jgi:uncharacterized protein (TIGR01777 family)
VLFRTGVVLGSDGGILQKIRLPFRMGVGGRLGSGKQYFPWIHVDDVVGVFLHASAHDELTGPVNLVAPEPATNAEFTAALARAFGRSAPFAVPGFALKLALGDVADEMLLASQRMSPARVLQSGYVFRYPLLQDALRDAVQAKGAEPGPAGTASGPSSASTPPTGTYPPTH